MKSFANHTVLTKVLSIALIATGVSGFVFWVNYRFNTPMPIVGNTYSFFYQLLQLSLMLLGFISGIALWRKKVWALKAAVIFFAIQIIGIGSPGFTWYPYVGFEMNLSLDLFGYWFALNFFALAMLILTLVAYRQISVLSQAATATEPGSDTAGRVA